MEIKTRAQAEIYNEIKDLSPEQQREYFRKAADGGGLADWWRALPKKQVREPRRDAIALKGAGSKT